MSLIFILLQSNGRLKDELTVAADRVEVLEKEFQDLKDENECVWKGAHDEDQKDAIFAGVFTRYIYINCLFNSWTSHT